MQSQNATRKTFVARRDVKKSYKLCCIEQASEPLDIQIKSQRVRYKQQSSVQYDEHSSKQMLRTKTGCCEQKRQTSTVSRSKGGFKTE